MDLSCKLNYSLTESQFNGIDGEEIKEIEREIDQKY